MNRAGSAPSDGASNAAQPRHPPPTRSPIPSVSESPRATKGSGLTRAPGRDLSYRRGGGGDDDGGMAALDEVPGGLERAVGHAVHIGGKVSVTMTTRIPVLSPRRT
ncbi:hypothetical protein GCM10010294_10780 [Streptomyces griseoloalbus]|nr:hypothetical protein GCM10010294_10780 [Streptomyces griseoloalbus]